MLEKQSFFKEFFTAEDISETLKSATMYEKEKIKHLFEIENYDVIGYKEKGQIVGYIKKENYDSDKPSHSIVTFKLQDLITNNTNLFDTLKLLKKHTRLFIINKSQVESIVTVSDFQKPAVRMFLFGIVTFFESNVADLIHETYPNNEWKKMLSEGRIGKATKIYRDLVERNQETNLINCTQLHDKTDIIQKDDDLLKLFVNLSKTKAEEYFDEIEKLRNDLAHAQSLSIWFEEKDVIQLIDDLLLISKKIVGRDQT